MERKNWVLHPEGCISSQGMNCILKGEKIHPEGRRPKGWIFSSLKDAIYPEGWNKQPEGCNNPIFPDHRLRKCISFRDTIWHNFSSKCKNLYSFYLISLKKKSVKTCNFTEKVAALIFLPRDSIGKFFPWEEFFNASMWFDEIFSALIFLPWDSIEKFCPWEEFCNAAYMKFNFTKFLVKALEISFILVI